MKPLLIQIIFSSISLWFYQGHSKELEVPQHLAWCIKLSPTNAESSVVTHELYSWIKNEYKNRPATQIADALGTCLLIRTNEISTNWKAFVEFQNTNTAPCMAALLWKNGSNEIFCLQLSLPERKLRKAPYSVNQGAVILTKNGNSVVEFDIPQKGIFETLPSICCFHGFLPTLDESRWPDIIYSEGPEGSGNFIYLYQLHYLAEKRKWKIVWRASRPHVASVRYLYPKEVQIDYFQDKFIGPKVTYSYSLYWGMQ